MGLEGAVKLGFRKEIAALSDPQERRALFAAMVDRMYRHGKAVSAASHFEIDDVIDPADSRRWITTALASAAPLVPDALASPLDSVTPTGAPEERSRARLLTAPCARATPAWPSVPSTTAARARARDGA
jgi:hypothetical protein